MKSDCKVSMPSTGDEFGGIVKALEIAPNVASRTKVLQVKGKI
jgi:hypothetical protein